MGGNFNKVNLPLRKTLLQLLQLFILIIKKLSTYDVQWYLWNISHGVQVLSLYHQSLV